MAKALLIKSAAGVKENTQGVWHLFDQAAPYIQGIETGDITDNLDAEILNSLVSGLPNVWARAYQFAYAFKYTRKEANIKTGGLIKYYESLIDEWKGLFALMAIYPDRITVGKPLSLKSIPGEIYDIASSFGDMLFEDTDLWCNPENLAVSKNEEPYIQIIYYNDKAVGATSPHTIFFTSVDYSDFPQGTDVPWFRNGHFCNPLVYGNLSNDKLQKIYLLVNSFVNKLPEYEKLINTNRNGKEKLLLSSVFLALKSWKDEIKSKGIDLVEEGVLDGELSFSAPFTNLFNVKQDLFYVNGIFSFNKELGGLIVDPQKLLLQDEYLYNFVETDEMQPLSESPVYYLRVLDPNDSAHCLYFPIPLSSYGLKIFKNKIGDLVSPSGPDSHELRAIIRPDNKVAIELYLYVDGRRLTPVVKEYKIKMFSGAVRNVIMWPDFVSKNWNKYYLYNEFPTNNLDVKFVPFFRNFSDKGGYDSGDYLVDTKGNLVYSDSDYKFDDLKIENIVSFPVEIATMDNFPYEIIRSNKPFAGIEIRSIVNGRDRICGYLIIKNDEKSVGKKIKDLSHESGFQDVVVGIDFGSNNSCVSYCKVGQGDVKPITFQNHRVFLSGVENIDPRHERTAMRNELLFFQNEEQENGQIKSWVHDHDRKYIPAGMEEQELAGGVPIFESNLVIHSMDERTITTNAGILHHNMKWLSDAEGKDKKKAYLKSVWMSTIADLYANRMIPTQLRWSYPGAFSPADILQYQQMYDQLANIPIEGRIVEVVDNPSTEAEAVCNYALSTLTPDSEHIMLGIDVGGSTSDVLVVAMDRIRRGFFLSKQSSIRLAAGLFVNVITQSQGFRNAVYKFHESPDCSFKVANIKNIIEKPETSPFYLNAVLDRLKDGDFRLFYSSLSQACPEIFAIPAYITGLLLFYSGKLVAKSISENQYTTIKNVDLFPFGKGGRLFDWLDVYPGKKMASDYYNNCFRAGFGSDEISLEKQDSIRKDNKSEVSKGLSAVQKVVTDVQTKSKSDIIGEIGYKYFERGSNTPIELAKDDYVDSKYLEEMDFGIEIPHNFVEFEKFLKIFCDFAGPNSTGILRKSAVVFQQKDELSRQLKSYITTDSEWQKADKHRRDGEPFDYKHSLLVLEGMCFLEKFIIPDIK